MQLRVPGQRAHRRRAQVLTLFGAACCLPLGRRHCGTVERISRSASTTLAYARIGYRLTPKTRLALDVFNLFNRRASDIDYYYQSRLPGEGVDGVNDVHFHPVEPRSVRLTLQHSF